MCVVLGDSHERWRYVLVSFVVSCRVQPDAEQQAVIRDIYTQVSKRPDTLCNFLEGTYVSSLFVVLRVESSAWIATAL